MFVSYTNIVISWSMSCTHVCPNYIQLCGFTVIKLLMFVSLWMISCCKLSFGTQTWLVGKSLSSALQLQDNLLAARGELNTYKPRLPRGFKDLSHLAGIMGSWMIHVPVFSQKNKHLIWFLGWWWWINISTYILSLRKKKPVVWWISKTYKNWDRSILFKEDLPSTILCCPHFHISDCRKFCNPRILQYVIVFTIQMAVWGVPTTNGIVAYIYIKYSLYILYL